MCSRRPLPCLSPGGVHLLPSFLFYSLLFYPFAFSFPFALFITKMEILESSVLEYSRVEAAGPPQHSLLRHQLGDKTHEQLEELPGTGLSPLPLWPLAFSWLLFLPLGTDCSFGPSWVGYWMLGCCVQPLGGRSLPGS